MTSLADCINLHAAPGERQAVAEMIREKQAGHLADSVAPEIARKFAVNDAIDELVAERFDILRQVGEKIGPPKNAPDAAFDETPDTVTKNIDSIIGALIHGGVASSMADKARDIRTAQEHLAFFESLDKLSQGSKTKVRVPEKYEQFVQFVAEQGGGNVRNIYVNAELFQKAIETMPDGPGIIAELGKEKEFVEAVQTGGDLVIPVGKYARHIAGTDLSKTLFQDLRVKQNGMSAREAEQARAEWAETMKAQIEDVRAEREAAGAFEKERKRVYDDVVKRREEAGRVTESARSDAAYWAAFAATWAKRYGGTPWEVYQKIAPEVTAEAWSERAGDSFFQRDNTSLWPEDFPNITTHTTLKKLKNHPGYQKAKSGDSEAAAKVVSDLVNIDKILELKKKYPDAVVVAAHAEEEAGKNALPRAIAEVYGYIGGFDINTKITQTNIPARTKKDSVLRLVLRPEFEGDIENGRGYILVDDAAGQGGTFSELRYFIESKGGKVVATSSLTAGIFSNKLSIRNETVAALKEKFGNEKLERFIRDFNIAGKPESLTEKEGRFILGQNSLDALRDRITEEERRGGVSLRPFKIAATSGKTYGQSQEKNPSGSVTLGDTPAVKLFETANPSTFLHESGHIFFDFMGRMASLPDAQESLKADWKTILDHVDNDGTTPLTRDQHETLARTMEAYFMAGKAPSMELRNVFQKFADWLKAVYKSVTTLKAPVSDEVRVVLDRMFATDKDIEDVQAFYDARKPFLEEANIQDEADRKHYEKLRAEARLTAADKRLRSYTKAYIQAMGGKTRITEEVRAEVDAMPVYAAASEIVEAGGFNPEIVEAVLGENGLSALSKKRPGLVRKNGTVIPEEVADKHGFQTAADLMNAILNTEGKGVAIKRMVDERLEQMKTEIRDGLAVDGLPTADPEYHSNEQMAVIVAEIQMLEKGKALAAGRERGRVSQIEAAAVRDVAKKALLSKRVSDAVDYYRFSLAEAKAAKQAREALKKGDFEAAEKFKRRELLNHALVLEAVAFRAEVTRGVKYVQRKSKSKTMEMEALDMVNDIAVRFDFKNRGEGVTHAAAVKQHNDYINETGPDGVKRKTIDFEQWMKAKADAGYTVDLPEMVVNRGVSMEYKDMTAAEFRDVVQAVKSIATVDMNERYVKINGKMVALNTLAETLVATLKENYNPKKSFRFEKNKLELLEKLDAHLVKVEFLLEAMDGGQIGPWHEAIFQPVAASESNEIIQLRKANDKIKELLSAYSRKERRDMFKKKVFIPEIGESLTHAQMLRVVLDMGNEGNYSRRRDGEGWTDEQMNAVKDRMTERDFTFIQSVWDYLDTFRPEAFALERKLTGREPERVMPRSVDTQFGVIQGGYFPVVIDPRSSDLAEARRQLEAASLFGTPNAGRAMTKHGHLKERQKTAGGQALSNELTDIMKHVDSVVHDISHRENVVNVGKILRNKKVMNALTEHLGVDHARVFMPWLKDIANQRQPYLMGEGLVRGVRIGTTVCKLGKLSVMAQQIAGFTQTIHTLGKDSKYLAKTFLSMGKHPEKIPGMVRAISAKSAFMNTRIEAYSREAYDTLKGSGSFRGVSKEIGQFVMNGIGYMQLMVDVPTWQAAYLSASRTMTDEKAVAFADSVVRKSQGGGGVKDLAAVQRGNEYLKLLTMFYSFMSTAYNIFSRSYRGKTIKYKDAASAIFWVGIIGPLLAELLSGRPPDEDKDETWASWVAKIEVRFFAGMLPVFRDIVGAGMSGFGYRLSPIEAPINTIIRETRKAPKAISEGDFMPVVKAAKELAGVGLQLPADQAFITAEAFWAWMNSDPDFKATDLIYGGKYKD